MENSLYRYEQPYTDPTTGKARMDWSIELFDDLKLCIEDGCDSVTLPANDDDLLRRLEEVIAIIRSRQSPSHPR